LILPSYDVAIDLEERKRKSFSLFSFFSGLFLEFFYGKMKMMTVFLQKSEDIL